MNNFDALLLEAKNEIMNEECVKEYFRLKKELDSNEELKSPDKEIDIWDKSGATNVSDSKDSIYRT